MKKYIIPIIIFLTLGGCRFPDDPNKTLAHIEKSHLLLIGFCDTNLDIIAVKEKKILELLSTSLNAKILWIKNNQEQLYQQLERNELNLVACEINQDSPWRDRLSFTSPFYNHVKTTKSYVFALPQGENAWLHYINRFINGLSKNESYK